MGSTVTIEMTDDGDVILHGWDEEVDLAAEALGMDASPCLIIAGALEEDRLDQELLNQAAAGNASIVELLIWLGADVNTWNGAPLQEAAASGHEDIVKILIKSGANIHSVQDQALHGAIETRNLDIVELLLDADKNPYAWDQNVLRYAAYQGSKKAMEVLKRTY